MTRKAMPAGRQGFTMIELLVVISIIGVLATLVFTSFTTSQKQARNIQRKSDLAQYRTALESFANKNNGLYPSRDTPTEMDTLCSDLDIDGCPLDPKNETQTYKYCTDGDGSATPGNAAATKYALWAVLENISPTTYQVVCSDGRTGTSTTGPACDASFNCNISTATPAP